MLYIIMPIILALDQFTKFMATKYLKDKPSVSVIDNILKFMYVENYGAAFGMLQNKKIFFIIITLLVFIIIIAFLFNKYNQINNLMRIALIMFLGGALGNFIDRIRLGYVIDFISIKIGKNYNFPVFNIADSFIVVATVLIIYMVIFNKYEV